MSGDLCVGIVDCSKFSEFAKLNGKITKEDWEEAEEMVKSDMWKSDSVEKSSSGKVIL